jgi:hypothetical protein
MPSPQNPVASPKAYDGMDTLVFRREDRVLQTLSEGHPYVRLFLL